MKTRMIGLAGIAALTLTACGGTDDDEQDTVPESADEVDAAEIEAQQEEEEAAELIREENELFEAWLDTEADSQEEADVEEQMEAIYDRLDELWDYPESEDDVPDEFYDLAFVQYIVNAGGDIGELLSADFEDEDDQVDDQEGVAPKDRDFSDDPILADREFTGRMTGDVTAGVGEPVEIDQGAFEGIGDYMGTVTLESVLAGLECYTVTDEVVQPEGELLVVTFTISADEDADSEFSLSHSDFRWAGFDGHIATYDTFACMDLENGTMDAVRPGDTATRTYIFDTPELEFEGTLTYLGATNYVDWEIEREDYDNADRLP